MDVPVGEIIFTGEPSLDLVGQAKQNSPLGLATRYALRELNPFIITGDPSLYVQHNIVHSLDLYDPITGLGMSNKYLTDRSSMLVELISRNIDDRSYSESVSGDIVFQEYLGNRTLDFQIGFAQGGTRGGFLRPIPPEYTRIAFGSDVESGDTIIGGEKADRLYGGAGNDKLFGAGGADYLEGGLGDDTLYHNSVDSEGDDNATDILVGGNGNDTYHVGLGDTILDSDKTGRVFYQGDILWGGLIEPGSTDTYLSTDNKYTYTLLNGNLTIDVAGKTGQITIQNFTSGDLGIDFFDVPPVELSLSDADEVAFVNLSGTQLDITDSAGTFVSSQSLSGPVKALNGLGGSDRISIDADIPGVIIYGDSAGDAPGLDGDDFIEVDRINVFNDTLAPDTKNGAYLFGEAGDDFLGGSQRDDVLSGDEGHDFIKGHAGKDIVFGGVGNDWIEGGLHADQLSGNDDNDWLFGGAGADQLIGGQGHDRLWGDAGGASFYRNESGTFWEAENQGGQRT